MKCVSSGRTGTVLLNPAPGIPWVPSLLFFVIHITHGVTILNTFQLTQTWMIFPASPDHPLALQISWHVADASCPELLTTLLGNGLPCPSLFALIEIETVQHFRAHPLEFKQIQVSSKRLLPMCKTALSSKLERNAYWCVCMQWPTILAGKILSRAIGPFCQLTWTKSQANLRVNHVLNQCIHASPSCVGLPSPTEG